MPLSAISRVEAVNAPTATNTYNYNEENSPYFRNYTGIAKPFQSIPNKSQTNSQNQIVYMERSVQKHIGHNLNIYA